MKKNGPAEVVLDSHCSVEQLALLGYGPLPLAFLLLLALNFDPLLVRSQKLQLL